MINDMQETVNQFFVTYKPSEDKPSGEELAQISEDARQSLELEPPIACVEWWSALDVSVQQKWLVNPKSTTMYKAWRESRKRLEAVNYSRASVGLEGFKPSPEAEALTARFVDGEIEFPTIMETIKEQTQSLPR